MNGEGRPKAAPDLDPAPQRNHFHDTKDEVRPRVDAIAVILSSALTGDWPVEQAVVTAIRLADKVLQLLDVAEGEHQLARAAS